ncbi:hypothetical protein F7644_02270 [Tenacibaculum finnmarkense genomovar ulcerans]|uniref:hypothetical protein n=1 Tax=Tenacibaculum finnmarkense TaxID=2781243 RepID=UPI00187B65B5|nr:hypothetical protein [Tenacibaculum finnmarkense]MBE7644808.1 hypothetical protein [Tenacibaculum finnmarkense genomovar ulcerans]
MIYLIDDKVNRQTQDYKWTESRIADNKDLLQVIYTLQELEARKKDILTEGSTILYHESFLDNTSLKAEASQRRVKLETYVSNNPKIKLVFFSGSKKTRKLNGNIAYLPVSVLYQNLEIYINKLQDGKGLLKYLVFGDNPEIENELIEKRDTEFLKISKEKLEEGSYKKIFLFQSKIKKIKEPLKVVNLVKTTLFDSETSDQDLTRILLDNLNKEKFDYIFIPLCFGEILSDFNGLRLATHIRCTKIVNQLTNIIIYGFVGLEYILNHQYFNILKTKNVELLPFSKKAFADTVNTARNELIQSELPAEIKQIQLPVPKNYEDSHSIANEWAIYRWANTIQTLDNQDGIGKVFEKIDNNLYFKYLQTIYPVTNCGELTAVDLKTENLEETKILYIDDEAEKGWYEVFRTILVDTNKVKDFQYLGDDFKSKSQEEIIEISIDKIIEQNSDIVILDFRLHPDDFKQTSINEITGLKILKRIKEINKGIQVLIFSATNKIWNLQAIQEQGADGFVIKESPENSVDKGFTKETITNFIEQLSKANKRKELKKVWIKLQELIKLNQTSNSEIIDFNSKIEIAFQLLDLAHKSSKYMNYAYLQLFLLIEEFIQLPTVFEKNIEGSSFVISGDKKIEVLKCIKKDKHIEYIMPISWEKDEKDEKKGKYVIKEGSSKRRIDTNMIVSNLLIFRFGIIEKNPKRWNTITWTRNNKTAHPEKDVVSYSEIYELLKFLLFFLDEKNISDVNAEKGLPVVLYGKINNILASNIGFVKSEEAVLMVDSKYFSSLKNPKIGDAVQVELVKDKVISIKILEL